MFCYGSPSRRLQPRTEVAHKNIGRRSAASPNRISGSSAFHPLMARWLTHANLRLLQAFSLLRTPHTRRENAHTERLLVPCQMGAEPGLDPDNPTPRSQPFCHYQHGASRSREGGGEHRDRLGTGVSKRYGIGVKTNSKTGTSTEDTHKHHFSRSMTGNSSDRVPPAQKPLCHLCLVP